MTIADARGYLIVQGCTRTEGAIKYLSKKYDLHFDNPLKSRSLDPSKIKLLGEVLTSPLRVAEVARIAGTAYSAVNYFILKHKIETERKYGVMLFKHEKDSIECLKNLRK